MILKILIVRFIMILIESGNGIADIEYNGDDDDYWS